MISILFEETIIIVRGRLFNELIKGFKANIKDIRFAPKIIVFTRDKKGFLEFNLDYEKIENKFYTFGGIATAIDEIKDFLNKENSNNNNNGSSSISQMDKKNPNNKIIPLNKTR